LTAPSQSPVPVGLIPAVNPSDGAKAATEPPAAGEGGGAGVEEGVADLEGDAGAEGEGPESVPSVIARCWATKVVDEAGQPTPGPRRF
jgi:hypothetical protein